MKRNVRRVAAALIVVPAILGVSASAPASASAGASATDAAGGPYQDKAAFVAALKKASSTATSAHVTMTMDASGQSVTMVGDTKVDAANPAMKMSMDMTGVKIQLIVVDEKIYMKGFPGLPAGKWAVLDSTSPQGKELADSLSQADPTKMYDQFDQAVTDVKFIGKDAVDGESMDKYELTLDTKAMEADLGSDAGKLPDTLTYTAWLDGDDHLRKVTFDILGTKADMTLSKYGEPVDITAPPASETVKAPM
jgi:hypothetical protein